MGKNRLCFVRAITSSLVELKLMYYKPLCQKVKALEGDLSIDERASQLPQKMKQKITDEILQKLRSLSSRGANMTRDIAMERGECMLVYWG